MSLEEFFFCLIIHNIAPFSVSVFINEITYCISQDSRYKRILITDIVANFFLSIFVLYSPQLTFTLAHDDDDDDDEND